MEFLPAPANVRPLSHPHFLATPHRNANDVGALAGVSPIREADSRSSTPYLTCMVHLPHMGSRMTCLVPLGCLIADREMERGREDLEILAERQLLLPHNLCDNIDSLRAFRDSATKSRYGFVYPAKLGGCEREVCFKLQAGRSRAAAREEVPRWYDHFSGISGIPLYDC